MATLLHNLLVFGRLLRTRGVEVHLGRVLDVAGALQSIDLHNRDDVFFTCRALLVHRHDDLAVFDAAFDAFWTLTASSPHQRPGSALRTAPQGVGHLDVDGADSGEGPLAPKSLRTWSGDEVLGGKDFAEFTPEEVALAHRALERLEWNPGMRRTRRWIPGRGPRVDLRRAVARSLRTGGEVLALPHRTRRLRPRPVVLLCDVSGSMERYSRMLLHFAHALTGRHRRVEAFLFSTQLTRVTRQLKGRRIDQAVAAVSKAVPDWSGGTRIGDALRSFHQQWSRRAMRGGPVVLLVSDGWDRGDPAVLRDQVARLQRSCHRLVWLNPLIGTMGYEPLTRGLQAALPFVDDFLPARTLSNLADLAVPLGHAAALAIVGHRFSGAEQNMDITGTYTFNAPPDRVWNLLMDPAAIASCIPGCDRFEPDGEDRYKAMLTIGLAAITGTYEGIVTIADKVPPSSYRLTVEGQGKPGFVKGDVTIGLRAEGETTIVEVNGTAQTGGMIARLGQRLIANVNQMMQDKFFACLQSKV